MHQDKCLEKVKTTWKDWLHILPVERGQGHCLSVGKMTRRSEKEPQNQTKKGKQPEKILDHEKKTKLTTESSFPLTTPSTNPQRFSASLTITQTRRPCWEPTQLLLTEKLVTQWCAQMLMAWLFRNKSHTKCEQKQTVIWPQKWCSQECLGSCTGTFGMHTALPRSCNTRVMHMVAPHVPQIAGSVYSMLHVLVHLHNCKERHFRGQDSGHKFGALGPGLNWAKSVAMQVYWTGGKKKDPLQCLLRTSHSCL